MSAFTLGLAVTHVGSIDGASKPDKERSPMTEPRGSADERPDGRYEIRLKGHLETRWAAWLDEMTLRHEHDGSTVLSGPVIDQAALHGLLQKVRDIGLPLVSVSYVEPHDHE
jgi:hypothetical protein